jgi:hypothetical protein
LSSSSLSEEEDDESDEGVDGRLDEEDFAFALTFGLSSER